MININSISTFSFENSENTILQAICRVILKRTSRGAGKTDIIKYINHLENDTYRKNPAMIEKLIELKGII